ncbi:class I SAM-dependent methyltransferase [bacterium]|nr:MAG: class I SAM-dependent methyltransferase [bacterium]
MKKNILFPKMLIRAVIRFFLFLHNFSYQIVGRLSQHLEPDGIHPKHRLMNYHQWFIDHVEKDWVVLDIGCGNGALAYDLKAGCKYVIAIDKNKDNIDIAKRKYSREGIDYVLADALEYQPKGKINAAVLSNILEHIDSRIDFLKKLSGICDVFLIRVPLFDRDWLTLYKKEMGIEWRLDPTHHTEYTFISFKNEMDKAGFNITEYKIQFGEIYAVTVRK